MALQPKYALYYSLRSPFARRVRIAIQRLAVTCEMREIDVFSPPAELFEANPLGLVPVLLIRQGNETLCLPDSASILEYLNETYGKIWPTDPAQRLRARAASALAEGIMHDCVQWYLENTRVQPSEEVAREHVENIDRTLAVIDRMPWRGAPWKVSDLQLTQAGYDLAVALEYLQLRLSASGWAAKYPELARFLEVHRNRQDLSPTAPPPPA